MHSLELLSFCFLGVQSLLTHKIVVSCSSGRRNDWCFLCEFQVHVERASHSPQPFSPINILSRLPSIGGNLGYGKQEDAHEFMRFLLLDLVVFLYYKEGSSLVQCDNNFLPFVGLLSIQCNQFALMNLEVKNRFIQALKKRPSFNTYLVATSNLRLNFQL